MFLFKKLRVSDIFAFTLVEVLIVIGIIGMIADLALPNLIKDFEKQQTISRLRKVYSTLNQALDTAKADYGTDVTSWEFLQTAGIGGVSLGYTALNYPSHKFVDTYLRPYLNVEEDCSYTSARATNASWVAKCGTSTTYKMKYLCAARINSCPSANTVEGNPLSGSYSRLLLKDGTLLQMYFADELRYSYNDTTTPGVCPFPAPACSLQAAVPDSYNDLGELIPGHAERCRCFTDSYAIRANIYVDLNGLKPPNVFGKDIFVLALSPSRGTIVAYPGPGRTRTQLTTNTPTDTAPCKSNRNGLYCSGLIVYDGWKIAPDYPWP